ncbi:Uma2 family endonuclease [Dyadobacter sp. NIV53]|uniref:Uma2 family endonuclease n=1 Tax=Dyadobacter sp. NIV53 TaxID=2861765 RepID=UPI001C887808|nr:Uma2 family endonuclease [Dyadobacter sp. NIV53]
MAVVAQKYLSETEYLERERLAEFKSEYYKGEVFAMAGAKYNHNRITQNLSGIAYNFFMGKSCNTFSSDMRTHIPSNSLYTYPDFIIVCGKNEFLSSQKDTLLNPHVIIEVLSESTEAYDRGEKFQLYRDIPSLKEYVLINSRKLGMEVFLKNDEGSWVLSSEAYSMDKHIEIRSVNLTLPVRDVYRDTEDLGGHFI